MREELFDYLDTYCGQDYVPMHMPGHKRNPELEGFLAATEKDIFFREWYRRDITEIDGSDNLHVPEGRLLTGMQQAAELYHSEHSFYLINGSTAGVLAAVSAAAMQGSTIIMMRHSHKSVYYAAMLCHLKTVFLPGEADPVTGISFPANLEQVKAAVEQHPEAKTVLLTSPTYEGISTNLSEIAQYLHERDIVLIVDAAHGAHFGMAEFLPENAIASGADLVIHSLHKTLPAPTQTALLHLNGRLVSPKAVARQLSVYQSSSPSYILMAGIDHCIRIMQDLPKERWQAYYDNRKRLSERLSGLNNITIYDAFSLNRMKVPEMGKMVIIPKRGWMSGVALSEMLIHQYHIQPEMAMPGYVLCIMSVMDRPEYYDRLCDALKKIDEVATEQADMPENTRFIEAEFPPQVITMWEALDSEQEFVNLKEAEDLIAGDFVFAYPPGQPILVPGERVTRAAICQLEQFMNVGCELIGMNGTQLSICAKQ